MIRLAETSGQERTEQATQKRREETRRRGQVAKSTEVNSAVILLVGFSVLFFFRGHMLTRFEELIGGMFAMSSSYVITPLSIRTLFASVIWRYFVLLVPLIGLLVAAGLLVNLVQVGFLFSTEPVTPKSEKINPVEGFKRIFSRRTFESLIRDIIKVVVVVWIGYAALKGLLPRLMETGHMTVGELFSFAGSSVFSVVMKILMGYAVIAVLDYAFQRWDYEKSMMMTRQEVRDELKQTEGDPLMRSRLRTMQREMARRRMLEEVPKAEVVITNPTEIAVALSYRTGMPAPVVVAKGRNLIAEKIRDRAREAGVPVVENVPLAQALYKAVDIGNPIPEDLYTAVAEVLAYIYQLKGKKVL